MTSPTTEFPTVTSDDEILVRPLTTVFTPPADCTVVFPAGGQTPSCYPPDFGYVVDRNGAETGYYSPGICPDRYTPGCELIGVLDAGETGRACVPLFYTCPPKTGPPQRYATSGTTSAFAIFIRWRQQDIIYLETHPLSPGVTPWTTTLSSSTSSISSTPSETQTADGKSGSKSGLSKGGVAGITIMCLVVGLAIGAFAVFLLQRRRRRHRAAGVSQPHDAAGSFTDIRPQLIGHTTVRNEQPPHPASFTQVPVDQTSAADGTSSGTYVSPTSAYRTSAYGFGASTPISPDVPEVEAREQQPVLAELHNDNPLQSSQESAARSSYGRPMYTTGQIHPPVSQEPLSSTASNSGADNPGNLSPNQEMEMLAQQQSQLRAKKETLLKLHEIEENERKIEARMYELRRS